MEDLQKYFMKKSMSPLYVKIHKLSIFMQSNDTSPDPLETQNFPNFALEFHI